MGLCGMAVGALAEGCVYRCAFVHGQDSVSRVGAHSCVHNVIPASQWVGLGNSLDL